MDAMMRDSEQLPWARWFAAVDQPAVDQAIAALYTDLDVEVARYQPRCDQSGRCCRFESFGHRLYVTALEIARFLRHAPVVSPPARTATALPIFTEPLPDACPYQLDGLCSVHTIRPHGCRIFFCQEGSEVWQQTLYETYLDRLKQMHAQWQLPYQYMEWRQGLRLGQAFLL